jgi:hypothetical protein
MDRAIHAETRRRVVARDPEADMRKVTFIALVALVACSASSERQQKPITWGTPQTPTAAELAAMQNAQLTLQDSGTFAGQTDPSTGGPGLADQLAGSLGGYAAAPGGASAKIAPAAGAVAETIPTTGLDPTCVGTTPLAGGGMRVTWGAAAPCNIDSSDATMSMHVTITGWLTWTPGPSAGTGTTDWDIRETYAMTQYGAGGFTMSGDASLHGPIVVGASTIDVHTGSLMNVTMSSAGMPSITETIDTSLDGTVGYVTSPAFCITSGGLQLVQRASAAGMPEQDQAWDFDWSGCDAFVVTHGS